MAGAEPTLVTAVVDPHAKNLTAVVEVEADRSRRTVDFGWKSKDPCELPDTWWDAVKGEVSYNRSQERRGIPDILKS